MKLTKTQIKLHSQACERYQNHAKQINLFEPDEIRQPAQGELI
jgi:hypothetical protein